jgi:hypothetical protein
MSDTWFLRSRRRHPLAPVRKLRQGSRPIVLAAIIGLSSTLAAGAPLALAAPIAGISSAAADGYGIINVTPHLLDDHADTFTQGVLTDASGDTIHLRMRDGDTKGFQFDDDTVIRDEDGNRLHRDDLHEGDVVLITTSDDDDNTADLIVDGGTYGFRPGGSFDIGNRLDDHGRWDWRARSDAPPFDPRRFGAIFRGFNHSGANYNSGQRDHREGDSGGGNDNENGGPRRMTWRWGR